MYDKVLQYCITEIFEIPSLRGWGLGEGENACTIFPWEAVVNEQDTFADIGSPG